MGKGSIREDKKEDRRIGRLEDSLFAWSFRCIKVFGCYRVFVTLHFVSWSHFRSVILFSYPPILFFILLSSIFPIFAKC